MGIAWGPGAGKYLAQWMVHGAADISMASFDPRRFGAKIDDSYRLDKAKEDYCLRHEIPFPHLDRPACRPSHSKTTPLYDVLKDKGAVYQDVFGWERPYWYAPAGMDQAHIHAFRRSQLHEVVGAEVKGLREAAAIADLSAFAKVEVTGADARAYLERVSSNRVPTKPGSAGLTYLVNANGRLEGETSIVTLGEAAFYLVYAAAKEASLLGWLKSQVQPGEAVAFANVSEQRGVIMIAGPKARDILSQATAADLSNAAFKWLTCQHIEVAGVQDVRALRVTYTGELGWELHVPMSGMRAVYEALVAAGEPLGLVHPGSSLLHAVHR